MFRVVLAMCFALKVGAQLTNVDDSSKIHTELGKLEDILADVKDEITRYFMQAGDPGTWYEINSEIIKENNRLLDIMKENFTSTMAIVNYTLAFRDAEKLPPLHRELTRARANEDRLSALVGRAGTAEAQLKEAAMRREEASAQQLQGDAAMKEAAARLKGLRADADALLQREGQLKMRLATLHDRLHTQKTRAQKVIDEERIAKNTVEDIKRKTTEAENAIKELQAELQALKAGVSDVTPAPVARVVAAPSAVCANCIKSEKIASGRGKKIRLVLLSD